MTNGHDSGGGVVHRQPGKTYAKEAATQPVNRPEKETRSLKPVDRERKVLPNTQSVRT